MRSFFDDRAGYIAKRDGPLAQYLEEHDGTYSFPIFRGYRQFKLLWNEGYLVAGRSYIRLMWNVARGDEHFLVRSKTELVGVEGGFHSGKEGVHDPKNILTAKGPSWEAQHLSRTPKPRLEDRL